MEAQASVASAWLLAIGGGRVKAKIAKASDRALLSVFVTSRVRTGMFSRGRLGA
jgi:hypothetical protein